MKMPNEDVKSKENSIFVPQTDLDKRLLSIRKEAVAKGIKLLGMDEVLEELKNRRAGE